jgi:uncharacterized iron-regulated membrane protein
VGAQLRPLARRVHFLAGILVAPFLLVLCLTGLLYVFSPQIHDDLYGRQLHVNQVGDAPRPVAEQVAAAMAAHPEGELQSVMPPTAPDRTTRVNLSVPGLDRPSEARTVYVDPYTNYLNGELTTINGRLPANAWLRHLHSDLHLGDAGRLYSETAASWLPVITVGGLVLWIAKQGPRRRSARELLVPTLRGKGEQTRLRGVHAPLGLWLTVGLLAMSITGLSMSQFAGRLFDARTPVLAMAPVDLPHHGGPIGVDRVLEVARAQGLSGELEVTPPAAPDQPFTVTETSPGLPIRKDSIAVDPYTAEITERIGWADYPFLTQLRVLGVEAHTGALFGLANQILLALLMIGTIVLIVVGYRMWWKRSPYRGQLPPPPSPALRQLTWPVGIPVVLVVLALGWLMPVFGISLMAFVVVDLVINAVRQRRERARRTIAAGALLAVGAVVGAAVLAYPSSSVSQDGASGSDQGQGPLDGSAASPQDGRAPGAVIDQPPPGNQPAPDSALEAGVPPPAPSEPVALPDDRADATAGVADGADDGGNAPSTPGGTGASTTPGAGSAANDSDEQHSGGGSGSDTPADGGTPGGGNSEGADGDSGGAGSSGGSGGSGGVGDTLGGAANAVTSLLFGVVDSLTGGLSGD